MKTTKERAYLKRNGINTSYRKLLKLLKNSKKNNITEIKIIVLLSLSMHNFLLSY